MAVAVADLVGSTWNLYSLHSVTGNVGDTENDLSRFGNGILQEQSIPGRLHCPFENCHKSYNSKKHLNEHFCLHPSHKPDTLPSTRVRVTARECAEKFLDDETNPYTRKLRVKELFQLSTDDELKQFALPRIANIVTPVDFLL